MFIDRGMERSAGGAYTRVAGDWTRARRWVAAPPRRSTLGTRVRFTIAAILIDVLAVLVSAAAALVVRSGFQGTAWDILDPTLRIGAIVAVLYVGPKILRKDYALAHYFSIKFQIERNAGMWTLACLLAMSIAFLARSGDGYPRGAFVLLYVIGFIATGMMRVLLVRVVRIQAQTGSLSAKRIMLVGYEHDVGRFCTDSDVTFHGMRIVAANVLRGQDTLADDLALSAAAARVLKPDDIYILIPWSEKRTIESCLTAFLRVPASIHLGPDPVLDRFPDAIIDRNGPITSLNLVRRPLSLGNVIQKRLFDIVGATVGLILLAPLLALVAVLIKLESKGPVFFLQRRYGFNQEPFRIFKFRSMTTLDDGREILQARAGDARITRVGRFIRRANIDELPQLINVLRGDMSLVGPRPHALAHDQQFERTIALYARRHNVKPGITGWAQVHGLRGEITSSEVIRKRVEHDLHYIDNWSIWLDLWIIGATILSPKAYKNAV